MILELCCENIESVEAAVLGGGNRIELCRNLEVGGLTPDRELTRQAVKCCHEGGLSVQVLIRSRSGDFVYTDDEVEQMAEDIRMAIIDEKADGIVIGALTKEGDIDLEACRKWMDMVRQPDGTFSCEVTFHRAFDRCRNPMEAIEQIAAMGCVRVLTSGQQPTAEEGIPLLRQLVEKAKELSVKYDHPFNILCGSGVTEVSAPIILQATGATEIHGSLRTGRVTDVEKVKKVMAFMAEQG